MQTAGLIFGILGGICAVIGGLTAGGVLSLGTELTWMFWFILAGVLLLVSIAFNTHRGVGGEY
jgi:hypothetical protein